MNPSIAVDPRASGDSSELRCVATSDTVAQLDESILVAEPASGRDHGLVSLTSETPRLVDVLVEGLIELGVDKAFGIVGGAIAPFADAVRSSRMQSVHCRHESGAAFAATEASLRGVRPAAVYSTTGPGLICALNGLYAARNEGARVVFLSAVTPEGLRGRGAFQETGRHLMPADVYRAGGLFDVAETIENIEALESAMESLHVGFRRPQGFLAHLVLPTDRQSRRSARSRSKRARSGDPALGRGRQGRRSSSRRSELPGWSPADLAHVVYEVTTRRVLLWVGYGARSASSQVVELAERLQIPVVSTPRAKGVFPERHALFAGVTGFAGHRSVDRMLDSCDPESVLVLGSRLGEFSSRWDPSMVRARGFIHVDLDPRAIGAAYPEAPSYAIHAEISTFLEALLERVPPPGPRRAALEPFFRSTTEVRPRITTAVRPEVLMDSIQRVLVDGSGALLIADAGNSFAWATHLLSFHEPERLRLSASWGSMGHAACGVLGAGLCSGDKAVAITGDGAMLMNNELSTAVEHAVPAVWIVLNDSRYGMIEHGMRASGYAPSGLRIPRVDFVGLACAQGADGLRVRCETKLDAALEIALRAKGPFVVDVVIDPEQVPPLSSRVEQLRAQGVSSP